MKKILTLLIAIICCGQLFAQFPIGERSFDFSGVTGNVYYPAVAAGANEAVANGKFPIVIIGHGFSINPTEYDFMYNGLAEDGYIVAVPNTEAGPIPFPSHGAFGADMAALITQYYAEGDDVASDFFGKVIKKSAIIGHSMGGGCAFLSAEYNLELTTMINMGSAETDPSSTSAAANVEIPTLTMAGSAECVAAGDQIQMYNALTSNYKAFIEITNASHCQFSKASSGSLCTLAESCSGFISTADQHSYMAQAYEPWLDFYLRGNCDAWTDFRTYLTTATTHTYQESGAVLVPMTTISADAISLCAGDMATLSSELSLTSSGTGVVCDYQWQMDGSDISGATMDTYTTSMGGDYILNMTNYDGIVSSSNPITVTVNPAPNPTIIASGSTSLCDGATVDLSTGTADSYQWYLDGNMISGATMSTYTTSMEGDYTVEVITNGCSGTSIITTVDNVIVVEPSITPSGATSFCSGDDVDLMSSSADSYQWYLDGNIVSGATSQTYTAAIAGEYSVEITVSGCSATSISNVMVVINVAPIPMITFDGTVLTSSSASSYQWYLDGNLISGATNQTYTPTMSGDYTVEIVDVNSCMATSAPTNVIITGINSVQIEGLSIYPNPTQNMVNVLFTDSRTFDVQIMDVTGKLIANTINISGEYSFDLSLVETGVYFVTLTNQQGTYTQKVVKY